MASEGSSSASSAAGHQFGLYRSIDARTEEFLRLSRKRQMRQGCACAAVATAVTVAVVVSIVLIYEYSAIYESSSKTTLTPNWLSVMNKSADAIPFEAKLNKAKINLDPFYVQFLPLILKTLKKNKYFDKIIEDDSTQSPLYEKREKPEYPYIKNIFSDTRNWMRMPTSRLYTIEYKTSPIVYFKNPTRNIDHFTKIRRIRDYQRIMNYVDKMISERVSFGSTVPMLKNTYSFYRKPTETLYTTPMNKVVEYITKKPSDIKNLKVLNKTLKKNDEKTNCRCPKRMSELLSKLIKSLQKLIPDFNTNDKKPTTLCSHHKSTTIEPVQKSTEQSSSPNLFKEPLKNEMTHEISSSTEKDFFYNSIKKNLLKQKNYSEIVDTNTSVTDTLETPKVKIVTPLKNNQARQNSISKTYYSITPHNSKIGYSLNSIIKLLKPSLLHRNMKNYKSNFFTTTKHLIEGTDVNYNVYESTTEPMKKITSTTKLSSNILTTMKNFLLQRNTTKPITTFPTFTDTDYEDYTIDTTPNVVNNFNILDVHSIELVKKKMLAARNSKENTSEKISPYNRQEVVNDSWNILHKIEVSKNASKFDQDSTEAVNGSLSSELIGNKNETVIEDMESTSKPTQSISYKNKVELQSKSEDITLEEDIDKAFTEDTISEDNFKSLENMLKKLNNSEIYNDTLTTESTELDHWELTKIKDLRDNSSKGATSMIPENRPSYLEIQRNDWKHEEHQDYDNNVNNYFFE